MLDSENGDYIKDDDIAENNYLKAFITEWKVEAGDTIILPIYEKQEEDEERGEKETYFEYDFAVDYGDGTVLNVKSYNDENRMHTYQNSGTYTIKITGKCESFSFNFVRDSKDKITKLVQWGVVEAKHYDFHDCTNLEGNIVLPAKNSFSSIESFRLLFYNCSKITGNIPKNLFKYAPNVITMSNVFNFSTGLTGTIPEELFYNCKKITNFRFTFAGSSVGGEIPENLFKEQTDVVNFKGVFTSSPNFYGVLPKKIFSFSNKIEELECIINQYGNATNEATGEPIKINEKLKIEELLINSQVIKYISNGGNSFTEFESVPGKKITIYLPANSTTETTFKTALGENENVIIETF